MANDWHYILKLMRQGDGEQVKFFGRAISEAQLGQTISAMANTSGGLIVIGIDVINYHLVGAQIDVNWIQKSVLSDIVPSLDIRIDRIKRDDKDLIIIHVPLGANPAYKYKKETFIRNHTKSEIASPQQESELKPRSFAKLAAQSHEFWLVHPPEELDENRDLAPSEFTSEESESNEDVGTRTPLLVELVPESTPIAVEPSPIDGNTTNDAPYQPSLSPKISLNSRQRKAISFLEANGSIKNMEYRNLYQVSHKTAHLELVDLVANGLIAPQGKGRSTCYVLSTGSQSLTTAS